MCRMEQKLLLVRETWAQALCILVSLAVCLPFASTFVVDMRKIFQKCVRDV